MVAALVVGLVVLPLVSDRDTTNLGPSVFDELNATETARRIDAGGPRAYPSLAGDDRPFWLQHVGDDPGTGWLALAAVVPGTDCVVEYDFAAEEFVDCEGRSYGDDGEGLTRYEVTVVDGRLVVDLNAVATVAE